LSSIIYSFNNIQLSVYTALNKYCHRTQAVERITFELTYHSAIQTHISRYPNFPFYQHIFPLDQNNPCKTKRFNKKLDKVAIL